MAIIGAGAAGLSAARELAMEGLAVGLLEARDRIGGRIYTHYDRLSGLPIELGAEFLHGRSPELVQILRESSLKYFEINENHLFSTDGKIEKRPEHLKQIEKLLAGMKASSRRDLSFAAFLDQCKCDPDLKIWASSYVEGFNAADSQRISVFALMQQSKAEEKIEGDRGFRLFSGYEDVAFALYKSAGSKVQLYRRTIAKELRWSRGKVRIASVSSLQSNPQSIVCKKCLITAPLAILQSSPGSSAGISFIPEASKIREAAAALAVGPAVKVILHFREPFLESRPELESMGFLHSQDESFPTWWTTQPLRTPLLTAWVGGPKASRVIGQPSASIILRAIRSLSQILHIHESQISQLLESAYVHDWQMDPFSCGAYSYVPAGQWWAAEAIAKPIGGTLYFAGEATDYEGHWGTVHGAMASGRRAANEILKDW